MINPNHISKIVHNVFNVMGVHNVVMERLVRGTLIVESDLTHLYDHSNEYNTNHGLCMMSFTTITNLLKDYIRFNRNLKDRIWIAAGVDIDDINENTLAEDMEHNIALMVAMTYAYYDSLALDIPEDNIAAIAEFYSDNYKEYKRVSKADFIEKYIETFVNA